MYSRDTIVQIGLMLTRIHNVKVLSIVGKHGFVDPMASVMVANPANGRWIPQYFTSQQWPDQGLGLTEDQDYLSDANHKDCLFYINKSPLLNITSPGSLQNMYSTWHLFTL